MSDVDDYDCPLCMEELDLSDRNFRPCPCGYQVKKEEQKKYDDGLVPHVKAQPFPPPTEFTHFCPL
jgi:hypothetical protein